MSDDKNNADMNLELREWIDEQREKIKEIKKEEKFEDGKKPSGNCEISGDKSAEVLCIKCGKNVCKGCYFKLIHICKKCVPPEIAGKWDGSRTDWEKELGVEWVD